MTRAHPKHSKPSKLVDQRTLSGQFEFTRLQLVRGAKNRLKKTKDSRPIMSFRDTENPTESATGPEPGPSMTMRATLSQGMSPEDESDTPSISGVFEPDVPLPLLVDSEVEHLPIEIEPDIPIPEVGDTTNSQQPMVHSQHTNKKSATYDRVADVKVAEDIAYMKRSLAEIQASQAPLTIVHDIATMKETLAAAVKKLDHFVALRQEDNDFADDEDEDEEIAHKKRPNNGPKGRGATKNQLQREIREHTMKLMKRESPKDPYPPIPSREEVEWHATGDAEVGPSLEDFVVDFEGSIQSDWNAQVTKIFVKDFVESGWYTNATKKDITSAFSSHVASLKKKYKASITYSKDEFAQLQSKSRSARGRRRLTLYYRRLRTCKTHPDLNKHTRALRELGVEGMSSDESTVETGPNPVYVVLKKSWRAPHVTFWLRDMDGVHLSLRITDNGRIQPGAWPHQRRDSTRTSNSGPVRGLPLNFYDNQWIEGLSRLESKQLRPQASSYDFSHSDEVARIVHMWRGVTNRANVPSMLGRSGAQS